MILVETNEISNKCTICNKLGHKSLYCPNQKLIAEKRQLFIGNKNNKPVIENKNILKKKKKKKKKKKSVSSICDSSSDES